MNTLDNMDIEAEDLQVRFALCSFKPGYLVVKCVDRASADWLIDAFKTLQPWEGASAGGGLTSRKRKKRKTQTEQER